MAWQLHEAKQRFSYLVEQARVHGPQVITRGGKDVAVVLSIEEYRKITGGSLLATLGGLGPQGGG